MEKYSIETTENVDNVDNVDNFKWTKFPLHYDKFICTIISDNKNQSDKFLEDLKYVFPEDLVYYSDINDIEKIKSYQHKVTLLIDCRNKIIKWDENLAVWKFLANCLCYAIILVSEQNNFSSFYTISTMLVFDKRNVLNSYFKRATWGYSVTEDNDENNLIILNKEGIGTRFMVLKI